MEQTSTRPQGRPSAPRALRYGFVGVVIFGVFGGVLGLMVGLETYPPTAWFAVLELGLPAGLLGALVGALVGAAVDSGSSSH